MEVHPLIDQFALHYDTFAGDVYTLDTAGITLTAGTLTAHALRVSDEALFAGTFGSGWTEPDLGTGTRLLWYPRKAAFRAGYVAGTQWDNASIGDYSAAFGDSGTASGDFSTHFGSDGTASGDFSTHFGSDGTASGALATHFGFGGTASEDYSTYFGFGGTASGFLSIHFGLGNLADCYGVLTLGRFSAATSGNLTEWIATDPILVIGNGTGTGARSNALTILKNGNLGLGVATPLDLLHLEVVQDSTDDIFLRIKGEKDATAYWRMGILDNSTALAFYQGVNTGVDYTYRMSDGAFTIKNRTSAGLASSFATFLMDSSRHANMRIDRGSIEYQAELQFFTASAGTLDWCLGMPDHGTYGDGTEFFIGQTTAGTSPAVVIDTSNYMRITNKLRVGDDVAPTDDFEVNGVTNLGDGGTTDYVEVNATGDVVFVGSATVWNDLQFQVSSSRVPASNFPNWEAFTTNTYEYAFDVDEFAYLMSNELHHSWKEGTAANVHLHLTNKTAQNTAPNGDTNQYAKFTVYIAYADTDETWQETSLTAELTIPTGTGALTNFYLDMGDLTLTTYLIEAQIKCTVMRIDATGGTEYADSVFITQVGMHLEEDTIGSKTERVK